MAWNVELAGRANRGDVAIRAVCRMWTRRGSRWWITRPPYRYQTPKLSSRVLQGTLVSDVQGRFTKRILPGNYPAAMSLPGHGTKYLAQGDSLSFQVRLVPEGPTLALTLRNSVKTLNVCLP